MLWVKQKACLRCGWGHGPASPCARLPKPPDPLPTVVLDWLERKTDDPAALMEIRRLRSTT